MSALRHHDDSAPVTVGSFDAWPQLHGAWYADPFDEADLRWWDGTRWTEDVKASDESDSPRPRRTLRLSAAVLSALARL